MPDPSDTLLSKVAEMFGGTAPNVYRVLAKNPAALQSFVETRNALESEGRLSRGEQAVVALGVAVETDCAYCESAFVLEARRHGVHDAAIKAIWAGDLPQSEREQLLIRATRRLMETHGRLGRHEIAEFEAQGLPAAELLEIITIISGYTLATHTVNLMRVRIDPEFRLAPDDPCKG